MVGGHAPARPFVGTREVGASGYKWVQERPVPACANVSARVRVCVCARACVRVRAPAGEFQRQLGVGKVGVGGRVEGERESKAPSRGGLEVVRVLRARHALLFWFDCGQSVVKSGSNHGRMSGRSSSSSGPGTHPPCVKVSFGRGPQGQTAGRGPQGSNCGPTKRKVLMGKSGPNDRSEMMGL